MSCDVAFLTTMTYANAFRCSWLSKESGVRFGALGGVQNAASGARAAWCARCGASSPFRNDVTTE